MNAVLTQGRSVTLAPGRPYPERTEAEAPWYDRWALALLDACIGPLRRHLGASHRRQQRIVQRTDAHDAALRDWTDAALQRRAVQLGVEIRRGGLQDAPVAECFGVIREAAARTLGRRQYASQLIAGEALLHGRLIEMSTGEGKTFAATLPAAVMALAGTPVHVITVNDYLAARDAEEMAPLYRFLGLTVGHVVQGLPRPERRAAYACAITYCCNKELAFDYLRDRVTAAGRSGPLHLTLQRLHGPASDSSGDAGLVLRGLHFAIVDEADSIFIDEARTPLILSASSGPSDEAADCDRTLAFARTLAEGADYHLDPFQRQVRLSAAGHDRLDAFAETLPGVWTSLRGREERIVQALSALHLYRRDQQYVVADGKVQIVDESTGRVMPDRSWERGLHQFVEAKEGVALTLRRETLARLTYQRLLRRYLRLAGMSGTAAEVAREIRSVYRLEVMRVPLNRPSRRVQLAPTLCLTRADKWRRVADVAERLAVGEGRPVLIGTRSVGASEELSALLASRGIAHALLNAKQDRSEAEVIAKAGERGQVTVATNMAGRGTDIRLGPGVAELGGLHVVLTEYHESRRIDRQLFGRCARQHDPGSCQAIVAVDDEIFTVCAPAASRFLGRVLQSGTRLPSGALRALAATAQAAAESRNARVRSQNQWLDQRLHQVLAFSGISE